MPDAAELFAEALRCHQSGRLAEAERLYRRVLTLDPCHADCLHLQGVIGLQTERPDLAVTSIQRALRITGMVAMFHSNFGLALQQRHRLDAAIAHFRQAIRLETDFLDAHFNLANALREHKNFVEAEACYRLVLALKPEFSKAYHSFGTAYAAQEAFHEAAYRYHRVALLNPEFPEAHYDLGRMLGQLGSFGAAISARRKSLVLRPDYPEANFNLGTSLQGQGRVDEAIVSYRRALCLDPDFDEARSDLVMALHYSDKCSDADIYAEARDASRRKPMPGRLRNFRNTPDPLRRLRVGYVSADFREHPVAYFLERVLASHDPADIEIFCYSSAAAADTVTDRLKGLAHSWRSIAGVPDATAAEMIERDGIDILLDLAGHTAHNRLSLFALRPAPLQVSWIGYFGTTGLEAIDYVLADRFVALEGDEAFFSEKIWRLPGCYLCYEPHRFDAPIGPSPALRNGYVTFGCFNNLSKISPSVIGAWTRILNAAPDARLFLKTRNLADAATRRDVLARFGAAGLEAGRLRLEGASPLAQAMAAYNEVDIALDPFPFGGGTTTAETLWMGVPLVTLRGERWTGRMSESILQSLGLGSWVMPDAEGYIARAVHWAADPAFLARPRDALRETLLASSFCDGPNFTRSLESAYRAMWRNWCSAAPPGQA